MSVGGFQSPCLADICISMFQVCEKPWNFQHWFGGTHMKRLGCSSGLFFFLPRRGTGKGVIQAFFNPWKGLGKGIGKACLQLKNIQFRHFIAMIHDSILSWKFGALTPNSYSKWYHYSYCLMFSTLMLESDAVLHMSRTQLNVQYGRLTLS